MARDYNIHVTWRGAGSKQAYGGGNLARINRGAPSGTKEKENSNLKGLVSIGLGFRIAQMGNGTFGAFTENRLRQRKFQKGLTFGKYAVGIALNPALGSIYMATDLSYRTLQYQIRVQKENREADYYKRLSGNNSYSNSRYRGGFA